MDATKNHACYELLLGLCKPYALTGPWAARALTSGAFLLPDDQKGVLEILRSTHPDGDLLGAGLIGRDDATGEVSLHRYLSESGAVVLPLIDHQGRYRDLMTESGCVGGKLKPVFEALRDRHTFDHLNRDDRSLFLTADLLDTVLLRSLGLAAAPVCGFDDIDDADLARLKQYFGISRALSQRELMEVESQLEVMFTSSSGMGAKQKAAKQPHRCPSAVSDGDGGAALADEPILLPSSEETGHDETDPIRLVFVGWSPASLTLGESGGVAKAVEFLRQLHEFQELQLHEIHQWSPSVSTWSRLNFALHKKVPAWIEDAILDSVYSDVSTIAAPRNHVLLSKTDTLADATRELQEMFHNPSDRDSSRERKKSALRRYYQAVHSQVVEPLLQDAQAADDPLHRVELIQLAQLTGLFSEKMVAVREHAAPGSISDPHGSPQKADAGVSEVLAIGSQMVSLFRSIGRCRRPRKVVQRIAILPPTLSIPHFAASAFANKS